MNPCMELQPGSRVPRSCSARRACETVRELSLVLRHCAGKSAPLLLLLPPGLAWCSGVVYRLAPRLVPRLSSRLEETQKRKNNNKTFHKT